MKYTIVFIIFFGFVIFLINSHNLTLTEIELFGVGHAKFIPTNSNQYSSPPQNLNILNTISFIKPNQFQIKLHDLFKGDVYCNISSITIDPQSNDTSIIFDYRGGSTLKLNNYDNKRREARGQYHTGAFEVNVLLNFNPDGTANGQWRNHGLSGNFEIIKKIL